MATRIHITTVGGNVFTDVAEDFDVVLERIYPLQQAASSLESRERMVFTDTETELRITVHPAGVWRVEEQV